jgi:hypothetical protein
MSAKAREPDFGEAKCPECGAVPAHREAKETAEDRRPERSDPKVTYKECPTCGRLEAPADRAP